jgi:hypothetical protein
MLLSWRRQQSLTIEDALAQTGQRWLDMYRANKGLPGDEHGAFFTAAGLIAEPLQSFSIESWEQLLRNYGPVIVTANESPGKAWAMHARVITGIRGDGTPENTMFTIVDPNGGRTYQESIALFIPKYQDEVLRTGDSRIQVAHWSADARAEVRAQSFGGRSVRTPHRTRAMGAPVVVPIVSSIAGAGMTRLVNDVGDITWELDQLKDFKHVGDNPANAGSALYQTQTITIKGPRAYTTRLDDEIGVNIEITFQYNGRSLGKIQVSIVGSEDAAFAGLVVTETIMDDANAYERPPNRTSFAAVKMRIHYRFTFSFFGDYIWMDEIVLYGDGKHDFKRRKTQ